MQNVSTLVFWNNFRNIPHVPFELCEKISLRCFTRTEYIFVIATETQK